jgi:hypothetical protein
MNVWDFLSVSFDIVLDEVLAMDHINFGPTLGDVASTTLRSGVLLRSTVYIIEN